MSLEVNFRRLPWLVECRYVLPSFLFQLNLVQPDLFHFLSQLILETVYLSFIFFSQTFHLSFELRKGLCLYVPRLAQYLIHSLDFLQLVLQVHVHRHHVHIR